MTVAAISNAMSVLIALGSYVECSGWVPDAALGGTSSQPCWLAACKTYFALLLVIQCKVKFWGVHMQEMERLICQGYVEPALLFVWLHHADILFSLTKM